MFIKVKAFQNSKKSGITQKSENSFEIRVKEKAKHGMANQAIIEILSQALHLPKNRIHLIKGIRRRNKIFEVKIL